MGSGSSELPDVPTSFRVDLNKLSLELFGETKEGCCIECKKPFEDGVNVHTEAGWRETKLSRMCESCFDDMEIISEDEEFPF